MSWDMNDIEGDVVQQLNNGLMRRKDTLKWVCLAGIRRHLDADGEVFLVALACGSDDEHARSGVLQLRFCRPPVHILVPQRELQPAQVGLWHKTLNSLQFLKVKYCDFCRRPKNIITDLPSCSSRRRARLRVWALPVSGG